MRNLFTVVVIAVALALSACAKTVNPLGTQSLAAVESLYGSAEAAVVAYESLPLCKTGTTTSLGNACAKRSVILQLQASSRQAQAQVLIARDFVKNNPTIDASTVIAAAYKSVVAFRSVATANGIALGS